MDSRAGAILAPGCEAPPPPVPSPAGPAPNAAASPWAVRIAPNAASCSALRLITASRSCSLCARD
eukprot:4351083-Prymnesium_polylepis.1